MEWPAHLPMVGVGGVSAKVLVGHCWSSHPFSFKLNLKKLLFGAKDSFRC